MIHYHGGPVTPVSCSIAVWRARHAMVSFANPEQVEVAAELCQSFALDNGAFTFWKRADKEGRPKLIEYAAWVRKWRGHPSFDWCIIPDSIDGDELENDGLISQWFNVASVPIHECVPVWHLHESNDRLKRLCRLYPRVALGSSGAYSDPGGSLWWERIANALDDICVDGIPMSKLHGLRMLNPTIFSQIPLSSADSTNVARNMGLDSKWDTAAYAPRSPSVRAAILVDRIESHCSAARWQHTVGIQNNLELIG